MPMEFLDALTAARRVSTPLIAIQTADPAATIQAVIDNEATTVPMIQWDMARGLTGLNTMGQAEADRAAQEADGVDGKFETNATLALIAARLIRPQNFPVIFIHNAPRILDEPSVIQALWNLRDPYKSDGRTVILLGVIFTLPLELTQDILILDHPLPTASELTSIAAELLDAAGLPAEDDEGADSTVDATIGMAAFAAEQAMAMSIDRKVIRGYDRGELWERKRKSVGQTKGLEIWRGGDTFDDIAGYRQAVEFELRILKGRSKPRSIVWIDEIEKVIGTGLDTSGTSQSMLGHLLSWMQDSSAIGLILVGPPGSGKSQLAKAAGGSVGIPTIKFDLSGMKGSLVGESEAAIRAATKVIDAVSQGRAMVIATCNGIDGLPPELRRRFNLGTFFVDLPTAEERVMIWALYLRKYELGEGVALPVSEGWTGAEIKQCCDLAWRLDCPVIEAASYIVPVAVAAREKIDKLRTEAHLRYLNASAPGLYDKDANTKAAPRRIMRDREN